MEVPPYLIAGYDVLDDVDVHVVISPENQSAEQITIEMSREVCSELLECRLLVGDGGHASEDDKERIDKLLAQLTKAHLLKTLSPFLQQQHQPVPRQNIDDHFERILRPCGIPNDLLHSEEFKRWAYAFSSFANLLLSWIYPIPVSSVTIDDDDLSTVLTLQWVYDSDTHRYEARQIVEDAWLFTSIDMNNIVLNYVPRAIIGGSLAEV